MKTLNIFLFFTFAATGLSSKEVREVKDANSTSAPVSHLGPSLTNDQTIKHASTLGDYSFVNKALFDKDYVENLEKENKRLKAQALNLASQVASNPWPFDSWLYYPDIGWMYLTSDAFPWACVFYENSSIYSWVFVDVNSPGFAFYDPNQKKWFEVN